MIFLLALAFGYFSSFDLLSQTTDLNSKGIQENVLGNNEDESVNELRFKMSERELHGIIHTHVISPVSYTHLTLPTILLV